MNNGREAAWVPVGLDIAGAKSIDEALKMAELDFEVNKQKLYTNKGGMKVVDNFFANVRSDNGDVLGVVTDKYKIVQNRDAFNFVDNLMGEGVQFEKGGVFHRGKAAWLEAKIPESYKILGDDVESHIVLVNSHDGKGAVKVCMIPNRIICSNQIAVTLKNAKRSWSAQHSVKIDERIKEAQETLGLADKYMRALVEESEKMALKKVSDDEFRAIIDKIYPVEDGMTARKLTSINEVKTGLMACLAEDDLNNFRGTALEKMNAVTDFYTHREGQRKTENFAENRFMELANGSTKINEFYSYLVA